jgi:hypothetical protein
MYHTPLGLLQGLEASPLDCVVFFLNFLDHIVVKLYSLWEGQRSPERLYWLLSVFLP